MSIITALTILCCQHKIRVVFKDIYQGVFYFSLEKDGKSKMVGITPNPATPASKDAITDLDVLMENILTNFQ